MRVHRDLEYSQPPGFRPISLDLRRPDHDGAPVVVYFHGGGFRAGTRKVFTPGIADAASFDRIVEAGFAVASCDYRLSGEARFPAQIDDADAAIDWVRDHADDYGLDASKVIVWGVSAGATIGALAALRRRDVCGVVDWFGPAELFALAAHDSGDPPERTREALWLGAGADTVPDAARAASPALQVHAAAPPFHIAHGTADAHVPIAQSELLAGALADAGVDVEYTAVAGGAHFWRGVSDTAPLFDAALGFCRRVAGQ